MKSTLASLVAAAIAATPATTNAQISTFDSTTGVLTIPSVSAGGASFTNVTLKADAQLAFTLQGATAQVPAAPGAARYDAATQLLTLPAVRVGSDTFLNVTLRDGGNYNFTLHGATPLAPDTLNGVTALLAAVDAQFASAVPATGAARLLHADGCYLHDGRSRAWLIAETDGNPTGIGTRDAYRIGQLTSNIQVLAERTVTNGDGSTRREIDVQYEQRFKDGSIARDVQQTLVTGSTSGTPHCSTPQSSAQWRLLGNQRLVEVGIRPRNLATQRYKLTDGAAQTPAVDYRRELRFWVTDPLGHATYIVVTGPRTIKGVPGTMSLKLLSPRVARSAPEMAGKPGNTLNWLDDDNFRLCLASASSAPASASLANCAGEGASGDNWGSTATSLGAGADAAFDALGFMPGGTFLFAVHADDGWKTVNGHAGRTPIATYTATLRQLPYPFADMAAGRFPVLHFDGLSPKLMRDNFVSATPAPLEMRWTAPAAMADNRAFRAQQVWEFFNGRQRGASASAYYPNYRYLHRWYPGAAATQFDLPITATPATMQAKQSVELLLQFSDRNDGEVISSLLFY
jgi:hypothetical protein